MSAYICANCGKPISKNHKYCNQDCLKQHLEKKKKIKEEKQEETLKQTEKLEPIQKSNDLFYVKGEGSRRREHNIITIQQMIEQGYSFQQIWDEASLLFTSKTFSEYYETAERRIKLGKRVSKP